MSGASASSKAVVARVLRGSIRRMGQLSFQVAATTGTPALLWQTTTGVSPDPITSAAGNSQQGIVFAGTPTDPVPIVITNLDPTNPVYLGQYDVASNSGTKLPPGGSLTRSVVGNDSEYAIATGATVTVSVEIGRQ